MVECALYLSVSGFLLASKSEPIINLRQYLLIQYEAQTWLLDAFMVILSKTSSRKQSDVMFLPEGHLGAGWESKAGGSVSNAPKPEENLAPETSPFMLVPSLQTPPVF